MMASKIQKIFKADDKTWIEKNFDELKHIIGHQIGVFSRKLVKHEVEPMITNDIKGLTELVNIFGNLVKWEKQIMNDEGVEDKSVDELVEIIKKKK